MVYETTRVMFMVNLPNIPGDWMRRCNKNKDAHHTTRPLQATSNEPSPRNTMYYCWTVGQVVHNLFNIQIVNPLILSRRGIKVSTLTKYSKHARNLFVI